MCAVFPLSRDGHKNDMMAFLAGHFVGGWGEWSVRIIGGILLLSATNTAVNGLMSIVYVMSRDNELPAIFQKLNGFGAPWVGAVVATAVPATVLLFAHDLETLSHLYAIGIVGAVAINCSLCAFHPRLRRWWRKAPMLALGVLLLVIWVTLAFTKFHALVFVLVVIAIGLSLRQATRYHQSLRPKPSLLRRAIMEQLPPDALARPKVLLATAGSAALAEEAIKHAKEANAALVVSFVRPAAVTFGAGRLNLDTDPAAQALFTDFLELGHKYDVPIIPMYDTGQNAPEVIAETAAMNGVDRVLIGSSRRGALHNLIKGSFQRKLESLLPPEIPVEVITPAENPPAPPPEKADAAQGD
jgi:nucleotide-binding universal stress UspA family protein